MTVSPPRVAVLLSTFDGARYLPAQLASLAAQDGVRWVLYWRDDGSTDTSRAVLEEFAAGIGAGRCVRVAGLGERLGAAASFLALLRAVAPLLDAADLVAFADQDDVWLPAKLRRGAAALGTGDGPALYCARQVLVDATLTPIGLSAPMTRGLNFPALLTQNIASGCTVMMNRDAVRLAVRSHPSPAALHDWWCALIVAGAGGRILYDEEPVVLYRQHAANLVGAAPSILRRGMAALRRGPGVFMGIMRQNLAALAAQPELLSDAAIAQVTLLRAALAQPWWRRLPALCLPGLRRQTALETLVFRLWFLLG